MARLNVFAFRINQDERMMLERLSEELQRSQSDAVRLLIREAVRQLPGLGQPEMAETTTNAEGGSHDQV